MRLRRLLVICLICVGALAGASPALAAPVTSSHVTVTSPHGTYLNDDQVTPNETITGTGTSIPPPATWC